MKSPAYCLYLIIVEVKYVNFLSCRSVVNGDECCNVYCVMDKKGSHSYLASALFKSVPCDWFPKDFLTKIHYYVVLYIQATYPA